MIKELYDLDHTISSNYLIKYKNPWDIIPNIKNIIIELIKKLDKEEYTEIKKNVWVHKSSIIYDSAYLGEYTIIGKNTEVRHNAYIRFNAIIGDNCVIGNSTEIKNAIIFDNVQLPHFNYVGDSILGYMSHLGAGAILSNVKSDKSIIYIHDIENIDTNMDMLGSFLGDYVEVGSNSVINPGTIIYKNTNIYPLSSVRGVIPANSIYKNGIIVKRNKDE